jgi:hypothetical protein
VAVSWRLLLYVSLLLLQCELSTSFCLLRGENCTGKFGHMMRELCWTRKHEHKARSTAIALARTLVFPSLLLFSSWVMAVRVTLSRRPTLRELLRECRWS